MSLQLDAYLQERANGESIDVACFVSGIPLPEARLTEKAIESGELALPRARAHPRTREDQSTKEDDVARGEETELKTAIHEKLEEAGFTRKPGTNEFTAPPGFAEPNTVERATGPSVAADDLRLFIERIERLAEERKGIADDIADVYGEAKARGYDKATMRRIVKLRAMDPDARQEAAALLETYADALGLQGALPL